MALGKLTFLCLNAICIGSVSVLLLGVLMQWYGGRLPGKHRSQANVQQADGHTTSKRRQPVSRFRTVDAEFYQNQIGPNKGERWRSKRDSEREMLYEVDG